MISSISIRNTLPIFIGVVVLIIYSCLKEKESEFYTMQGVIQFEEEEDILAVVYKTSQAFEQDIKNAKFKAPDGYTLVTDSFFRAFRDQNVLFLKKTDPSASPLVDTDRYSIAEKVISQPTQNYPLILTGEISVEFKKNVSPEEINALLAKYKFSQKRNYDFAPERRWDLTPSNSNELIKISNEIFRTGKVLYSEPRFIAKTEFHSCNTSNLSTRERANKHHELLETFEVFQNNTEGNSDVVIAILDEGIDYTHEQINENWIGEEYYVVDEDEIRSTQTIDSDHGTLLAGLAVGASDNATNQENEIIGTCPNCSFLPIQINENLLGVPEFLRGSNIKNNIDVLLISISTLTLSSPLRVALDDLYYNGRNEKGVVIVASLGNNPNSTACDDFKICSLPEVIAVSGVCLDKEIDNDLSTGSCLDLVSISDQVASALPKDEFEQNLIGSIGQTSAASGMVAGIAGLIRSNDLNLSSEHITHKLISTTNKTFPSSQIYNILGRNDTVGYGFVNAFSANQSTSQLTSGTEISIPNIEISVTPTPNKPQMKDCAYYDIEINPRLSEIYSVHMRSDDLIQRSIELTFDQNFKSSTPELKWFSSGTQNVEFKIFHNNGIYTKTIQLQAK